MAFFKFRQKAEETSPPQDAPQSIETLRKRARYRLAGAVVLVLTGVLGFPLLFDSQPRPIAVDIPIIIPDKNQVPPLAAPTAPATAAGAVASGPATPATAATAAAAATLAARPASQAPTPTPAPAPSAATAKAPAPAASTEAARAQALLDGKAAAQVAATNPAGSSTSSASDGGRFVVQFGSFSDAAKAHEARVKVERAGFKTYAQIAQMPEGKRYRVRVGPFTHRAEADKAAEKIRKLNLSANILEL